MKKNRKQTIISLFFCTINRMHFISNIKNATKMQQKCNENLTNLKQAAKQ